MEVVGLDVDLGHFGVGDLDGFRVVVVIETAMDGEPGPGRGGADQSHDHGMGEQRFAAPVLRDEGEEAMFDAVPLCALPRRIDVVGANPTGNSRSSRKPSERIRRRRMV